MPNILNKYIKKYILLNILITFLVLISISSIIKLFDELRNLKNNNYLIFDIFFYTILNLPKEFDLFIPTATLVGGLLGLSILETRNELIIMQIAGLSKIQIAFPIITASAFILLFNIISNEWLLPYSQKLAYTYKNNKQYNTYLFSEKNKNLWLLDKKNFIYIEKVLTTQKLLGVNLYYFTENKKIHKILYIERAIYANQQWSLFNITELDFTKKIWIIKKNISYKIWNTVLTPQLLSIITIHPRLLSISNIMHCIQYFNKVGQNSKYYQLIFWDKIIAPMTGIIMISTALLYNWGPLHKTNTNVKLFFGSITGFLFYILHQICETYSMIYNISPILGAIGPIILLSTINIILLCKY